MLLHRILHLATYQGFLYLFLHCISCIYRNPDRYFYYISILFKIILDYIVAIKTDRSFLFFSYWILSHVYSRNHFFIFWRSRIIRYQVDIIRNAARHSRFPRNKTRRSSPGRSRFALFGSFFKYQAFHIFKFGLGLKKYRQIGFSTWLFSPVSFNRITTWWLIKDRREEEKVFLLPLPLLPARMLLVL